MSPIERDVLARHATPKQPEICRPSYGEFALTIGPEMELPVHVKHAFEGFLNGDFIAAHRETSQPHKTRFQEITGLPSPIVRIDASSIVDACHPEGSIYEVEARPSGLGILTGILNAGQPVSEVFERVSRLTGQPVASAVLPSVRGVSGGHDRSIDTLMLAQAAHIPYLSDPFDMVSFHGHLWARGGKEDGDVIGQDLLSQINSKSVAPLIDHGDKSYMVGLGMATLVNTAADINFDQPCCVKPLHGSKGKDVQVWVPKPGGLKGSATRNQVARAISAGPCICQPFIPTGTIDQDGVAHHKLMRLFAVMNDEGKYELIPSPYVTRPNLKIHGSSDAITGLITFS